MSYKATNWAYELPLKGPAKPLLVALADFADEAGSCYPGQDRLALMTGLSRSSVQRNLKRLERMGLLTREHRYDKRGYRTSDRYVLSLDTQVLGVTEPTGQRAYWSERPSLSVTVTPTYRKNHQEEPSGGQPTPPPVDNSQPTAPSPFCIRHPHGSDRPCTACKIAREEWQGWKPVPGATTKPIIHIEGLCDAHRQPEATCEMCAYERAHPIDGEWALS